MKTHSFNTDDALAVEDLALKKLASFAPEKNSTYRDADNESDIYIETPNMGLKSLHSIIKKEKGESYNVTPNDMMDILEQKFQLSHEQAQYVIQANAADGMASATGAFGLLEAELLQQQKVSTMPTRRGMSMSKITIGNDGDVEYSAGNKILFDCPEGSNGTLTQKFPKLTDDIITKDFVTINMSVNLGKLGDKPSQPITINVAGKGKIGEEFVTRLQTIKSQEPSKTAEAIVEHYTKFSESIYEASGADKKHKAAMVETLSPLFSSRVLTEEQQEQLDDDVSLLKKFNSFKQSIAETLVTEVYSSLEEKKDKVSTVHETTKNLRKFLPNQKDGYLKLVAEDLVSDIDKVRLGENYQEEKKNIIQRFIKVITKLWHGYEKDKLPNFLNEASKVAATAKDKIKTSRSDSGIYPDNTPDISKKVSLSK